MITLPFRSLKTRVTLFTLAIFLICIWSLAFYVSRMLREDMQRLLGEQQLSTVSLVAAEINGELETRIRALEQAAASIGAPLLERPAALQQSLEQRVILRDLFNAGLLVLSRDGTAVADVPLEAGRKGTNYFDNGADHMALTQGKTAISRPMMGRRLQVPLFNIAAPIRDERGKVIGALVGVIDLKQLSFLDTVGRHRYGKSGGYLVIAPRHQLIVTATDKTRVMQPVPAPGINALFDQRMRGFYAPAVAENSLGVENLSSAERIPAADWLVIAALPTVEAFAPIRDMVQRIVLSTILLTLLAGGLTWWMLRRQLAPVLATAKALAGMSLTSQPVQTLPIARNDEVGELISGFNRLLDTLKQREAALKESEMRFRSLTEMSSDWYWEQDRNYRFTFMSSGFRVLIGEVESVLGKTRWEVPHVDTPVSVMREHDALLAAHKPFKDLVIKHMGRNNTVHYIQISGEPVFDELGQFSGYRGVCKDITARTQAEQALERESHRNEVFLRNASDGVHIVDVNGNVLECSDSFCEMLGYRRDELIGANVSLWDARWSPSELQQRIAEQMANKTRSVFETRHRRRDGSVFDVEVSGQPLVLDGQPALFNSARDVTEHKQAEAAHALLEAQLRESQKMEALGTLAGGVAHDFNNIIAAISGNAELARQDVGPGHAALLSLEEIAKASRRAKDLVQQILAFGRRQKASRKVISLAPVVEESGRLLRTTLPAGVSLTVECAPEVPSVLADATQVEQVVLNLCANAWQAMQDLPRPGTIKIQLRAHQQAAGRAQHAGFAAAAGEMRPGRYACLSVQDNGCGMDEKTLARIFEPFFTTKPVNKGTGLGLAVVHGIVKEHGACIEVDSTPGAGSSFRVYFPATQTAAEERRASTSVVALRHGQGKHILYVDDEEAIVLLMTRLLERQGYRVSGYCDPRAALAAVRANGKQFNLAVTDYNMPTMSGLEVARALREIRADLPVVLASGYITEDLRQQAPAAGICELIYKPSTAEELCAVIARVADAQYPPRNSSCNGPMPGRMSAVSAAIAADRDHAQSARCNTGSAAHAQSVESMAGLD